MKADAGFVGNLREQDRLDLLFTPVYSRTTHAWAGYCLDRLVIASSYGINIYELSTGKKLETILPLCDPFNDHIVVWKDAYGAIHVATGSNSGRIYHYVLQK